MTHAGPVPFYRRVPWIPIAIAVCVLLSSAFSVSAIRDVASLEDVAEATLQRPIGYVMLAPLSNVLDMITLLSRNQHIALVIGMLVLFVAWCTVRGVRRGLGAREHAVAGGAFLVGLLALYAAVALLPRPMATLVATDAHILRVDFHSHTSASHDVRSSWTAERNRAWHRAGGYDVAFITDHGSVAQAERAQVSNPTPAGEGVTLLQAIEVTWMGEHVSILGAERLYKGLLTQNRRDVDPQSLQLASLIPGREPVVILHHPRSLNRVPVADTTSVSGIRAVEISNGAPDVMDRVRAERVQILAFADRRNLMMTTGTDNHGWGRTAPNWTLLRIFNWRAMSADQLAAQIENVVRQGGFGGARVIERRSAEGTSPLGVALTVVVAPWRMLTTLGNDERVSWLIWIALLTIAIRVQPRLRRPAPVESRTRA